MVHIEINLHKPEDRKIHFDILNKILGKIKITGCIWNIITTLSNWLMGHSLLHSLGLLEKLEISV